MQPPQTAPGATPVTRVLTASLLAAPLISLAASSLYAARGWEDGGAGVLHVLGAIGYGFVFLAVVSSLGRESRLAAALLVIGLIGMAGDVAYGFDTIHQSLGESSLVDHAGAAVLLKVLGLFFPLALLVSGVALQRVGHRVRAVAVVLAAIAFPVAHIANIAEVAVPVDVVLTVAFGSLVLGRDGTPIATGAPSPGPGPTAGVTLGSDACETRFSRESDDVARHRGQAPDRQRKERVREIY